MDKEYITLLLRLYFTNEASHAEREALFAEMEKYSNNEDWVDIHTQLLSHAEEIKDYNPERFQFIIDSILSKPVTRLRGVSRSGPRVRQMYNWIAAACIILLLGIASYVILSGVEGRHKEHQTAAQTHDVPAPTNTRAVITLANGQKVYLDSANNGTIAQENNVTVVKNENGIISYELNREDAKTQGVVVYNTLFNPRGSKVISLTLSDGTKVWLNSESSLKYPIAFNGDKREVEITGEAYFEVEHNSKQPFKVHLPNGSIVEDIGTAFNINAFTDEDATKTTLIEGSVRVFANGEQRTANSPSIVLKPNQQSVQIPQIRAIRVQNDVDIEDVLSWKNGKFSYTAADIKTIMRDVARWYDVEIVFEGDVNEKFYANVPRNTNVSTLLKMLEITKAVHFKVEGKRITVMK